VQTIQRELRSRGATTDRAVAKSVKGQPTATFSFAARKPMLDFIVRFAVRFELSRARFEDKCGGDEAEKNSKDTIADVTEIGIGRVSLKDASALNCLELEFVNF
jgi:hypothetical protein